MKIGAREYIVGRAPRLDEPSEHCVRLEVRQWGMSLGVEEISPAQARELAAKLLQAANVAEGKGA